MAGLYGAHSYEPVKAVMTAKETSFVPDGSGHITNAREIAMEWKKIDRTWKISRVLEVKTLH